LCIEKIFTLFRGLPNEMKYSCCICPFLMRRSQSSLTTTTSLVCPYDPNCSSMYSCGEYLADVKVKNHSLKCQRCQICKHNSNNDNIKF